MSVSKERITDVSTWLADPITQDFIALVLRAACISRERALATLSAEDKGACYAYRCVIDELIGAALYESDQKSIVAEAGGVAEDALAARRATGE